MLPSPGISLGSIESRSITIQDELGHLKYDGSFSISAFSAELMKESKSAGSKKLLRSLWSIVAEQHESGQHIFWTFPLV
eukprot:03947_2